MKPSKSQLIREVFGEYPEFLTPSPPSDWLKTIQKELSRRKATPNISQIYLQRRKLMGSSATRRKKRKVKQEVINGSVRRVNQPVNTDLIGQLTEIRNFADRFGGVKQLSSILTQLESIANA